jgi:DNA replication protein DnaC
LTNSHANNCILRHVCKLANTADCTANCPSFISLHGRSGRGGRVGVAGLPAEYRLITLADSPVRESQPEIYKRLDAYVNTFARQFEADGARASARIKSLYLWSESPGTGKTTTASALLNEWLIRHYIGCLKRGRQVLQRPAVFLDVNEWQTRFNLAVMTDDERDMERFKTELTQSMNVPFLVMDDIGVRDCSEKFRGYLHAVINHRTANGLPTVYTSNLPIEEMAKVFDARLYDRMRDQCFVMYFAGESKRGLRKN